MKILIVDDEKPARDRLRQLIDDTGEHTVVGEACNGEQAIELAARETPDIVLLDMPERGVIGIGEPVTIPTAAAIGNAVANAIGVRVNSLPITPPKVRAALRRLPAPRPAAASWRPATKPEGATGGHSP